MFKSGIIPHVIRESYDYGLMDGRFQHLDENYSLEILLNDIHVIIHADDTSIISTGRANFVQKCNEVVRYFSEHRLKLNWGKIWLSDYKS